MGSDIRIEDVSVQKIKPAADAIRRLLAERGYTVIVLDGSLSNDFFDAFAAQSGIDWTQVIVYLAGEYLGVDPEAEDSLRGRVIAKLLGRTPIVEFHAPRSEAANPAAVVSNFAQRLTARPPDLAILGSFAAKLPETENATENAAAVAIVEIEGRRAITMTAARLRNIPFVFRIHGEGGETAEFAEGAE